MNFSVFNRISEIENNRSLNILFLNYNEVIVPLDLFIQLKNFGNLFVVCNSPFQIGPLRGKLGHLNIKFILPHQIPPNINFDLIIVETLNDQRLFYLMNHFNFKYVYILENVSSNPFDNYYQFDENCFRSNLETINENNESENNNDQVNDQNSSNIVVDADQLEEIENEENETDLNDDEYEIMIQDFAIEPIKYDKYQINYLAPAVPGKVSIILIISKLTDTFFEVIRDIKTQLCGSYEFILIDNGAGFRSNVKPNIRYSTKMPIEFCQYHAKEISTGEYLIFINEDSPTFQISDFLEQGLYETR